MDFNKKSEQNYFALNEHNSLQISIFVFLTLGLSIIYFYLLMPLAQYMFEGYLLGKVINDGTKVHYLLDTKSIQINTNFILSWAVDVYKDTPQEARYWFNPLLSLGIPSLILGIMTAFLTSSLLPQKLGYIHQKIVRETAGLLDELCLKLYGFHSEEERNKIRKLVKKADLRDLHDYERDWQICLEDLLTLNKSIKWLGSNFWRKLIKINNGIKVYLRFYFTERYSNNIIGVVYMGAACLIIIIGLRGLKFIPANEPSLVLFALGLEFSLLIFYAITLMYSKNDTDMQVGSQNNNSGASASLDDVGTNREVEKLLKAFVKTSQRKD